MFIYCIIDKPRRPDQFLNHSIKFLTWTRLRCHSTSSNLPRLCFDECLVRDWACFDRSFFDRSIFKIATVDCFSGISKHQKNWTKELDKNIWSKILLAINFSRTGLQSFLWAAQKIEHLHREVFMLHHIKTDNLTCFNTSPGRALQSCANILLAIIGGCGLIRIRRQKFVNKKTKKIETKL